MCSSLTICFDRVVLPVAGVSEHDPRPLVDPGGFELLAGGVDHRFEVAGVVVISVLISAASTIWPSPTTSCAL